MTHDEFQARFNPDGKASSDAMALATAVLCVAEALRLLVDAVNEASGDTHGAFGGQIVASLTEIDRSLGKVEAAIDTAGINAMS